MSADNRDRDRKKGKTLAKLAKIAKKRHKLGLEG